MNAATPRTGVLVDAPARQSSPSMEAHESSHACPQHAEGVTPDEAASRDPDVLRAALTRIDLERRRAECSANIQMEVVTLALDLLVREPDTRSFFGALTKTMAQESESHTCAVWLIDEQEPRCELWMAYVKDRLFTPSTEAAAAIEECEGDGPRFPCESMARHLFDHAPSWTGTVEYVGDDPRLPEPIQAFSRAVQWDAALSTPLVLGALKAGAKAYVLKDISANDLVSCIRDVLAGKTYLAPAAAAKLAEGVTRVQLTPRELATLRLLADGKANKEIASELDISERTVKTHLAHLFEKVGVTSRTEAIKVATRRGLVRLE